MLIIKIIMIMIIYYSTSIKGSFAGVGCFMGDNCKK